MIFFLWGGGGVSIPNEIVPLGRLDPCHAEPRYIWFWKQCNLFKKKIKKDMHISALVSFMCRYHCSDLTT